MTPGLKAQISFASVSGLGYDKNVLYPRPITLPKRYLRFYIGVMGLTCLIKLVSFLYLICAYTCQ